MSEHVHLAYATTVHGTQGETADVAVVGPGVDAAGLYVGMTRGRDTNEAIVIARSGRDAQIEIAKCLIRGSAEVTIADSMREARAELRRAARQGMDDRASGAAHASGAADGAASAGRSLS